MAQIKIPAALTTGSSTETVAVTGATVGDVLDDHASTHGPQLKDSVVEDGQLKEFINVFIDGEEATSIDDPVPDDALIRIMPAASGGR